MCPWLVGQELTHSPVSHLQKMFCFKPSPPSRGTLRDTEAAAGLGGCPFSPGASGNTASEDLVFTFENMGVKTGIDLEKLLDAAALIDTLPDVDTGGHVRALPRKRICA